MEIFMNTIYLIVAILILAITIMKAKKYFYHLQKMIPILLIGMAATLTVLIFPFSEGNDVVSKVIFSIFYAAQTILLNENISLIGEIVIQNVIDVVYVGIMYLLILAMPLLTVSFLISLLSTFTAKLKLLFIAKKKVIIFSDLNERSITIAENLKDNNTTFIFASCQTEENEFTLRANKIKALKLSEPIEDITMNSIKSKDITFYILSENEDDNLNKTLQLIEKYKNKNYKIYLITNSDMPATILDSTDKGNIRVEIVNEIERTVCQVLQDKPLYLNAMNHEISVLIVGGGKVGLEFLKTITWCGQMIGYTLNITVMDLKANKIKENIMLHEPELMKNYHYQFIEVDVNSEQMEEKLNHLKNINYIIVTLSTEEDSLREAMFLRKYFISQDKQNFIQKPIINVWIASDLKNEQVNQLKNEKGNQYDLNAFGSIKQIYYRNPIINSTLEEMTKRVHLAYMPEDKKLLAFYRKDYNIRSSRAFALHIKYKIYSILNDEFTGEEQIDLEKFSKYLKNEEVLNYLIRNEHNRWMAYMRSNGFQVASPEEVARYHKVTNHHVNFLAKLHPALVEYDKLKDVEKQIGVELENKDKMIIEKIPEIVAPSKENIQQLKTEQEKIETYIPKPVDTSDVVLNKEVIELSEKLAENVHEVWAKNRIEQGWKYGEKRDDKLKLHSCLVPYNQLPEEEKKYDRDTLLESLKVLTKLGYKIEKK